jgi:hypothetical protein
MLGLIFQIIFYIIFLSFSRTSSFPLQGQSLFIPEATDNTQAFGPLPIGGSQWKVKGDIAFVSVFPG